MVLFAAGCETGNDRNIYCDLSLEARLPDGRNMVTMRVKEELKGSFMLNLNTSHDYDFPLFVNGRGRMTVQKGVYMISFDAEATFEDGTVKTVRCSQHNAPDKAVNLVGDTESLVLDLYGID